MKELQLNLNTKEDLYLLIENEAEESTTLEFKGSFATKNPKWKEELAKDVSAMANSNGGIIVFGLKEKELGNGHSVAEKLSVIPSTEMTKDRLSQLLSSNIQPVIDNLEITHIPDGDDSGYFVVQIPQSNTAHQNRISHIYYKRRNATVEAMEDYEIRDVMNRSKTPVINLEIQLIKTVVNVTERQLVPPFTNGITEKHSQRIDYKLVFRPVNDGQIFAQYINYLVYLPTETLVDDDLKDDEEISTIFGENTTRDVVGFDGMRKKYGEVRYDPILPGTYGRKQSVAITFEDVVNTKELPNIKYQMHADNAPVRLIEVEWDKIEKIERIKNEIIDPFSMGRI